MVIGSIFYYLGIECLSLPAILFFIQYMQWRFYVHFLNFFKFKILLYYLYVCVYVYMYVFTCKYMCVFVCIHYSITSPYQIIRIYFVLSSQYNPEFYHFWNEGLMIFENIILLATSAFLHPIFLLNLASYKFCFYIFMHAFILKFSST